MPKCTTPVVATLGLVALLAGCATSSMSPGARPVFAQDGLPEAVRVPAGQRVAMETVGSGTVTYECKERTGASGHEWTFVGPDAVLTDRAGRRVGRYYGPPATWESTDGSRVTGAQVAVAPAGAGNLPTQLVRAQPATGMGSMNGVTFIQRVATRGGVAPSATCDAAGVGKRQVLEYRADYIFWAAR